MLLNVLKFSLALLGVFAFVALVVSASHQGGLVSYGKAAVVAMVTYYLWVYLGRKKSAEALEVSVNQLSPLAAKLYATLLAMLSAVAMWPTYLAGNLLISEFGRRAQERVTIQTLGMMCAVLLLCVITATVTMYFACSLWTRSKAGDKLGT